jgi:hypothetical protein
MKIKQWINHMGLIYNLKSTSINVLAVGDCFLMLDNDSATTVINVCA